MNEFEIEFDIKPNEFEIDLENVIKEVYPQLENLEVTPTSSEQVFNHPDSYGYDEVVVNAVETEELNITPSKETQSFDGLYNKIEVEAVTNEIDSNIVAENIKDGVEILGVEGSFVGSKYAPRFISFRNYRGTDLDYEVANLDTSNITDMGIMFYQCMKLKKLDLSSWNTKNTTSMVQMFYYCMALNNLDISNFDTSNVTDMNGMFNNCANLTSLNVSSFNTSEVTKMHYMFGDCRNLTSLDLSNFDTSNVTHIYGMFSGCNKLTHLDIRGFTFDKITTYANTFDNIPADCLIIVKSDTEKQWILTNCRSDFTNIKTVAEL